MSKKLVDLRPDRSLLNPHFDGYKLSLSEIGTISENFENQVYRLVPNENQYSFLHAKLFMLQNHLYGEQEQESVYFVDSLWNIQKYTLDPLYNQFERETVWRIPVRKEENSCNVSLHLTTQNLAVVSDGMGLLYILNRDNNSDETWLEMFAGEVLPPPHNKFIISDSVYRNGDGGQQPQEIDLLLTSVEKSDEKFCTVLTLITLRQDESNWNQTSLRELRVNGHIQFANLERSDSRAVYVVSDSGCKFTLDSENEIVSNQQQEEIKFELNYTWTQTHEEVILKFRILDETTEESSINVSLEQDSISVQCRDENLLNCLLYQRINPDSSSWTLSPCHLFLEITLCKAEGGLVWPQVGSSAGLEAFTSETEASAVMGTTFNSQQVEECDFECEKLSIFERLQCDSHETTHRINLGSHRVLLTVNLDRACCLALGIRCDVDTCIWQPHFDSDGFSVKHSGTLLSLAYIQASKQQMKFFAASPDLSTSVICDDRHVFIYSQNKSIGGGNELRNRVSGRRFTNLAQQQVFSLPTSSSTSYDDVLGIHVSNKYIYILGQLFITALKL